MWQQPNASVKSNREMKISVVLNWTLKQDKKKKAFEQDGDTKRMPEVSREFSKIPEVVT
jgi:hypothetical protein